MFFCCRLSNLKFTYRLDFTSCSMANLLKSVQQAAIKDSQLLNCTGSYIKINPFQVPMRGRAASVPTRRLRPPSGPISHPQKVPSNYTGY